jgi:hypothetical protein
VEILRETIKSYAESPEKMYMPELLDFYLRHKTKNLSHHGQEFERWVQRRNQIEHPKQTLTEDWTRDRWAEWWPEFQDLLGQFDFLSHHDLIIPNFIKRGVVTKAQICRGPFPLFRFEDKYDLPLSLKGVEPEESLLLVDRRNSARQLLLYPFMVVRLPADFYLFEQGERRKGDLKRVVFASLGPGEALEVRKADQNRRIIEDLESRLSRLGEIGIPLNGLPIETIYRKPKTVAFQEAYQLALQWADAGYPYHMVEGISDKLKAQIRHPPAEVEISEDDVLNFLMVAALHHGGNWHYWVKKNVDQPQTVVHLLRVLGISYTRPRLRALFALQCIEAENLKETMKQSKDLIPPDMQKIIPKYVVTSDVPGYLLKIKQGADPDMSKKASGVLREINLYCGESIEVGESSDLPLL